MRVVRRRQSQFELLVPLLDVQISQVVLRMACCLVENQLVGPTVFDAILVDQLGLDAFSDAVVLLVETALVLNLDELVQVHVLAALLIVAGQFTAAKTASRMIRVDLWPV